MVNKPALVTVADHASIQPFFLGKRIKVLHQREYFHFRIESGWNYLLRRIFIKYPDQYSYVNDMVTFYENCPPVYIEFFKEYGLRAKQNAPIPIRLISTPAANDNILVFSEPAPCDTGGFSVNMTCASPASTKTLNILYVPNDIVNLQFTNIGYDATYDKWLPEYIEFMAEGYYLRDKRFQG
jgi:hypothetical protein